MCYILFQGNLGPVTRGGFYSVMIRFAIAIAGFVSTCNSDPLATTKNWVQYPFLSNIAIAIAITFTQGKQSYWYTYNLMK